MVRGKELVSSTSQSGFGIAESATGVVNFILDELSAFFRNRVQFMLECV
jgi:hypothetical protein